VLRSEGFNVEVTGRGEEAIEMIKRLRFDIMFVDVYMTPISGIDVPQDRHGHLPKHPGRADDR